MFKIYACSNSVVFHEKNISVTLEIDQYQQFIDSLYEEIGHFKISFIEIFIMDNSHPFTPQTKYPYLIILQWNDREKEFYFYDTILGVIEMLSKVIPIQEGIKEDKDEQ
jgi:hypothetical protein